MADGKRYFISSRSHFHDNRIVPAGTVMEFQADKCKGRQFKSQGLKGGTIVDIDKPSKWMTEVQANGRPLGETGPAPVAPAPAPARGPTLSELGKHASKRPSDREQ